MIKWDHQTRTVSFRMPSWQDRRWMVPLAVFILFDILVSFVDVPLAEYMKGITPETYHFFYAITKAGDSKYVLVPMVLVLPFLLAMRQALGDGSVRRTINWLSAAIGFVFISVASSGLLVNLIKGIVGRTRPKLWFLDGDYGFVPFTFGDYDYNSFPSGHSNTIFALAIALSFFIPRFRMLLIAFASVVAFSRIALTAHYLTDVLTGSAIAIYTTYAMRRFFARRGWVFIMRNKEYRLSAPGFLLSQKLRAWIVKKLHLRDGAKGRLPR